MQDGRFAPPPIALLMGFTLVQVDYGLAVFECTPDESAYNPIGVVHGGLVCTLADSAAGCAVQTTLEAGVAYTSIDINVTYLRPVTKDTGLIRATGTHDQTGPARGLRHGRGHGHAGANCWPRPPVAAWSWTTARPTG